MDGLGVFVILLSRVVLFVVVFGFLRFLWFALACTVAGADREVDALERLGIHSIPVVVVVDPVRAPQDDDKLAPVPGAIELLDQLSGFRRVRIDGGDLGRLFRDKVGQLTAAFEDDAPKAQAFERLRALIEAVVLTPEDGDLAIDLRSELASMLLLCAGAETQKASAGITEEAL